MWIRVTASPLNRMSTRPASLRWVGQVVGSVLGGHPGQVVAPSGPPGGECTLCLREWAVAVVLIDLTLMIEPRRASQRVVERTRVEVDRGRLLDEVLDILDDPLVSDADAGRLVRARIGMPRLQAARRPAAEREPRDRTHNPPLGNRDSEPGPMPPHRHGIAPR